MSNRQKLKILPPQFRHVLEQDFFVKFTPWQRFKLAIGFNVNFSTATALEHSPGKHRTVCLMELTSELEAPKAVGDAEANA